MLFPCLPFYVLFFLVFQFLVDTAVVCWSLLRCHPSQKGDGHHHVLRRSRQHSKTGIQDLLRHGNTTALIPWPYWKVPPFLKTHVMEFTSNFPKFEVWGRGLPIKTFQRLSSPALVRSKYRCAIVIGEGCFWGGKGVVILSICSTKILLYTPNVFQIRQLQLSSLKLDT